MLELDAGISRREAPVHAGRCRVARLFPRCYFRFERLLIRNTPVQTPGGENSQLDLTEIELAILTAQCLDRHIPDMETLTREGAAWEEERNRTATRIDWQFTTQDARIRLRRLKAIRLFQDGLDRIWMDYPPGWERIRAIFEYNLTFAHQHPDLYELWSGRPVPGFVPSEESMAASWKVVADAVQALGEVIDAGVMAPPLPPPEATDLLIAVIRGLTAMHLANEPEVPGAAGRFGQLVPWAVALFQSAWAATTDDDPSLAGRKEEEG